MDDAFNAALKRAQDAPPAPVRSHSQRWLTRLRTRIVLLVRWWFRLEIDDLKERQAQGQIDALFQINKQMAEAVETVVRISNQMQARLQLYEREIPRMRELKRHFDLEQAGLRAAKTNGVPHRSSELGGEAAPPSLDGSHR